MSGSSSLENVQQTFEQKLEQVYRQSFDETDFGFVSLVSVERLSGGASQETYRITVETQLGNVVHAMRRAAGGIQSEPVVGHPGLEAEALLIQSAKRSGVPEPEIYYVLKPSDDLGSGFIMEWLEGEALGARITRGEAYAGLRESLAYECGKIMAQVHQIDLDQTGLRQKLDEVSPRDFVEQTWERYKLFDTPHPMIDYTAVWLMDNLPESYTPALVHNDFRNGNFMVSESEIVAVLDWELAHIGDPMRDLGWICVNSWRFGGAKPVGGFGDYEDLFKGYEEVSGQKVDPKAVKFWEVFGSFWWAVGCLGMAEHYRNGPDKTVERPAIGRRSSECQIDCVNLLIPGAVELITPDSGSNDLDMPRVDELLTSVRDFLRADVMAETTGRVNFLARVSSNSLDIALREWQLGAKAKQAELARLQAFTGEQTDLGSLRWKLVHALRDGSQSLHDEALQHHLRQTAVNQIAIDQPKYSGFRNAISQSVT
jgi:aminoglycoside phosphotransferase (APT) family kinase protein